MPDINDMQDAVPAQRAKQPTRRVPRVGFDDEPADTPTDTERELAELRRRVEIAERAAQAEPLDRVEYHEREANRALRDHVSDIAGEPFRPSVERPVNPYAASGWGRRGRTEFDLELPSGRLCRVMRLERDDLLRLNLMQYLDTFTPMLLEDSISDEERQKMMTEEVRENPEALGKMLKAIDKVVMSATIKPRVTDDESLVNYGTEKDWGNPDFVPVAFIDDIDTFERMFIFGASFGRSMDDLKSVLESQAGVASLADVPSVSGQDAE
jgi:hypothetical protein